MFQTDINMRDADTRRGELQERKRHNKQSEYLEQRGQNMGVIGNTLGGLTKGLSGGIVKAMTNHPEWYLKDPILATQNTQISTQIPVGYNQSVFKYQGYSTSDQTACCVTYWYTPVVCMYNGTYTDDPKTAATYVSSSPMNYVNKALYAWIKNKCRRNLQYTPADIIRTMLAVMDVYCDLESIKRVYRLANTYTYINRTLSVAAIKCLGFNPDTVFPNLAEILYRVNRIGKLISTIKIPVGQTVFDRWMYLASHFFKDSDDDKARLFAFAKSISYALVFGEKSGNFNRALRAEDPLGVTESDARAPMTPGINGNIINYIKAVERRATYLLSNSEILAAMADMLTAFEANGFVTFVPLGADETQEFVYDINAIYQVKNATITGFPQHTATVPVESSMLPESFDLYDLNDGVLAQARAYNRGDDRVTIGPTTFNAYAGHTTVPGAMDVESGVVNGSVSPRVGVETYSDHPDAGELLTVTRLSAGLSTAVLASNTSNDVTVCNAMVNHGTEFILGLTMANYGRDHNTQDFNFRQLFANNLYSLTNGVTEYLPLLAYNAKPRMPLFFYHLGFSINDSVLQVSVNASPLDGTMLGSFNKILYIDNDMLERWHFVAVASEFAMPNVLE